MYDRVLRLKHWQFFAIGFVVPGLFGLGAMVWWFRSILRLEGQLAQSAEDPFVVFDGLQSVMLWTYAPLLISLILGWAWYGVCAGVRAAAGRVLLDV